MSLPSLVACSPLGIWPVQVVRRLCLNPRVPSAADLNRSPPPSLIRRCSSCRARLGLRQHRSIIAAREGGRGRRGGRVKDGTLPPTALVLAPMPPRRSWHDIWTFFSGLLHGISTRNLCIRTGMGKRSKRLIYFHLSTSLALASADDARLQIRTPKLQLEGDKRLSLIRLQLEFLVSGAFALPRDFCSRSI
jgi:hypothetical protein